MLAFGLSIFTGALLLFLVQPLIARFILPWFGGTPAVWTTCMLFFQVLLLGGYAYAHLSIRQLAARRQVVLHLALLATALLLLPIAPGDQWKPPDGAYPMGRILWLLTLCLGLPYLVLSATGPLMQAWFSQAFPGVPPYRLYALSNAGSLLALVSYPFFVEPNLSRRVQAVGWSVGLGLFALLAAWCGAIVWRRAGQPTAVPGPDAASDREDEPVESLAAETDARPARWLWFALPACGSVLLLAVTNTICQDIAVIPFLWVLPLSLYLLSFILSFDSPRWYGRRFWMPLLALALGAVLWVMLGGCLLVPDRPMLRPLRWLLNQGDNLSMFKVLGIYLGTLFVACVVCHGELYRLRPPARSLTGYYLAIAAGGALGGLFVAGVAPLVFPSYFELHAGLFAAGLLAVVVLWLDRSSPLHRGRLRWAWAGLGLGVCGLGAGLYYDAVAGLRHSVTVSRNFYGVLRVEEYAANDPEAHEIRLLHGGTTHGLQLLAPQKRRWPTSYYTRNSGVGRLMEHFPKPTHRRVGVVGLGTGSMAAWSRAGDYFRIYEINEAVQRLARHRFFYLADSPAQIEVVLGDARLSMEREPDQRFDILVLDAFSSDAIPVHLLTREAFETYLRHLQPDGVLAVHISNQYLDLEPVVLRAASHFGFRVALVHNNDHEWDDESPEEAGCAAFGSDWALLTKNEAFLKRPEIADAASAPRDVSEKVKLWTDEESNLFRVLEVNKDSWLGWLRRWMP